MVLQRTHWHVFVDKDSLISISAISKQFHKVLVMEQAEHEDLNEEFPVSLKSLSVELLNCYHLNNEGGELLIWR